jgi:integrase/recombinase XerD
VQKAIERFLTWIGEDQGYSENTINAYRGDLSQFLSFCKAREIEKWASTKKEDIEAYLRHLEDRAYARATVARKIAATRSFFQFLLGEGTIAANPAAEIASVRVRKSEPEGLSRREVERLLREAGRGRQALRDRALLALLTTGLSASEAISLNIEDLELGRGRVFVRGRRGQERIVELGPTVVESLRQYLATGRPETEEEEGAFFLNYRGQRLTRQGLWLVVKGWGEAAGVKSEVSPRLLRYSTDGVKGRSKVGRAQPQLDY